MPFDSFLEDIGLELDGALHEGVTTGGSIYFSLLLLPSSLRKFVSELGSICSHHSEKHFGKSNNSEQKYGAYISTFYVRTTSFAKNGIFSYLCKKDKKNVL